MKAFKGWCAGFVKCDLCGFIALYVYHKDTERIQCIHCNNMVHYEISSVAEWISANTKGK